MKRLIPFIMVAFTATSLASTKTLEGNCKKKAFAAAAKAFVIDDAQVDETVSPQQNDYDQNTYDIGYSDSSETDQCFYTINVKIKPLKQTARSVTECTIIKAEDDGQPNCG